MGSSRTRSRVVLVESPIPTRIIVNSGSGWVIFEVVGVPVVKRPV